MRSYNRADELRARYLGEIAPLLEAAHPLGSLSPEQQRKVRRRILRTVFGIRHVTLRGRLLPLLAALVLFVIGGAAFATAQRWGLLPRLGGAPAESPAVPAGAEARKRKVVRGQPAAAGLPTGPAAQAAPTAELVVELPEAPDTLRVPFAGPTRWFWAPPDRTPELPASPRAASSSVGTRGTRPVRQLAMATPPALQATAVATVNLARVPAPVYPAPKALAFLADGARSDAVAAPAAATVVSPAPPAAVAMVASSLPARPAPSSAPSAPAGAVPGKPQLGDQAWFGQALRRLRTANDAAGALASLREHAKAYPKSPLAGERDALEVEALLALHREREALGLLDAMPLEELPRSGERLVLRGELRAAARRWQEAAADFDRALARVSGAPAWHERALWGRGVARLRMGEREGGMADVERYRDRYPAGRFAAAAAKLFPER